MPGEWITGPDILCHYGIKGMKWGVRRYQNEDGTWTDAGKARRNKNGLRDISYLKSIPDKKMKNMIKPMLRSARMENILKEYNAQADSKKRQELKKAFSKAQDSYMTYKQKLTRSELNAYSFPDTDDPDIRDNTVLEFEEHLEKVFAKDKQYKKLKKNCEKASVKLEVFDLEASEKYLTEMHTAILNGLGVEVTPETMEYINDELYKYL